MSSDGYGRSYHSPAENGYGNHTLTETDKETETDSRCIFTHSKKLTRPYTVDLPLL